MPDPKTIHVVGAAIIQDGRCLVAQRSETMSMPLKWEFPGGKVRFGEDPREALTREIREELGLEVEVGELLGTGVAPAGGRQIALDVYLARLVGGTLCLHEHRACEWFGSPALHGLDWAEADIPVVTLITRYLLARGGETLAKPQSGT